MATIDISALPRIPEQEEGNVKMWFENEEGTHIVSLVKGEIRISTPTTRDVIPCTRGNVTESDVRRALRNWIKLGV